MKAKTIISCLVVILTGTTVLLTVLNKFSKMDALISANIEALTQTEWNPDTPSTSHKWYIDIKDPDSETNIGVTCTPGGVEACEPE